MLTVKSLDKLTYYLELGANKSKKSGLDRAQVLTCQKNPAASLTPMTFSIILQLFPRPVVIKQDYCNQDLLKEFYANDHLFYKNVLTVSIFEVIVPVQYFLCVALLFRRKFQVLVQRLLWQQPRQLRR